MPHWSCGPCAGLSLCPRLVHQPAEEVLQHDVWPLQASLLRRRGRCSQHEWPLLLVIEAVLRSSFHRCQKTSLILDTARYLTWKAEGIQAGEAMASKRAASERDGGPGLARAGLLGALQPRGILRGWILPLPAPFSLRGGRSVCQE